MDAGVDITRDACAPAGQACAGMWDDMTACCDLQAARAQVMKLQLRIAKAQMAGRYGRAGALQWMLMRSLSARLLAGSPQGLEYGQYELMGRQAVRRVYKAVETGAFALRMRLCWRGAGRPFKARGVMPPGSGQASAPGTERLGEQHMPAVLAELAMSGLERDIVASWGFDACIARSGSELAAVCLDEDAARRVLEYLDACMWAYGLERAADVPVIFDVREGIDFGGFRIRRGSSGRAEAMPSRADVRALLADVRRVLRQHGAHAELIAQINRLLCAWGREHAWLATRRSLEEVDQRVRECLWRWALARHPRKGAGWVRRRYLDGAADAGDVSSGSVMPVLVRLRDMRRIRTGGGGRAV